MAGPLQRLVELALVGLAMLLGSVVYAAWRLNRRSQRVSAATSKTGRPWVFWRKS